MILMVFLKICKRGKGDVLFYALHMIIKQFSFRPQYSTELYHILCGSKSERKMLYFTDNNVGLNTFLSITDKQLQTIGITLPFHRYKILNSIYRFHKHPYLPASIPNVQKNDLYRFGNKNQPLLCSTFFVAVLLKLQNHWLLLSDN